MGEATLLLIAQRFPPENTSGAARPFRFYKFLPEFGYRCEVIAGAPQHAASNGVHRVPASERPLRWQTAACQSVQRLLPYNEHLPWLPHAVAAGRQILEKKRCAALFSTSPPLVNHLAAWRLSRRFGLPWIADFRDPLAGNPFRNRRYAGGYDRAIERLLFAQASALIANTEAVAARWREQYPEWRSKMHVIWNGFDPDEPFGPAPAPSRTYRTLAHVGTIYGGRHPAQLLDSISRLAAAGRIRPESFRLEFTGPVESHAAVALDPLVARGLVAYDGLMIARREAQQKVASADMLLLLDNNSTGDALQVPAKIFDYVRTGRPILALTAPGSPAAGILARSGVPHVLIHPGEPNEVVDAKLLELLSLDTTPRQPSDWFWQEFDGRRQTGKLAGIADAIRGVAA